MSKNLLFITHKTSISEYVSFLSILPFVIFHIKNWFQYLQAYSDQYKGIVQFRDGFKLYIEDSSDISSISTSFFRHDYGQMSREWKTIIDIGAHKGFFTVFAAKYAPKARIYSYEPIYRSYRILNKNIKLNKLGSRIQTYNLGVAGRSGLREINLSASSTDNTFFSQINSELTGKTTIKCTSLKNIINENRIQNVDLLKLDCEGAEFEILMKSGSSTLKNIKEIRMEYHNIDKKMNILRLSTFLKKEGFLLLEQRKSNNSHIGYALFLKQATI